MGKKLGLIVVLAAIVIFAGALFASPYVALERIEHAADEHDSATISAYIDFPEVRDSLKVSLRDLMRQQVDREPRNPLKNFTLALGGWLSDRMVDAFLTPDTVAALMRGETVLPLPNGNSAPPPPASSAAPTAPTPPSSGSQANSSEAANESNQRARLTAGYQDFNHFLIHVYRRSSPDKAVVFTLTRQPGWFSWQLTAIALPPL